MRVAGDTQILVVVFGQELPPDNARWVEQVLSVPFLPVTDVLSVLPRLFAVLSHRFIAAAGSTCGLVCRFLASSGCSISRTVLCPERHCASRSDWRPGM